jgi:phosphoglycerate dehydrogenase-like enzyme
VSFTVGLSADLSDGLGGFSWGEIAIDTLQALPWNFLGDPGKNFTPEIVAGYDAVAFAGPGVVPGSFSKPEDSPIILARFGVGYDNIDLAECTRAGVALTITPDGSKKPVATAALTLVLATLHRLHAKENLARIGAWDKRLAGGLGQGLNGKTVGTIGFGNIGSEFFRLIAPFDCERLSFDPWKTQADADAFDVTLVHLDELLKRSDILVLLATLTPETHHVINEKTLRLMKPSAVLVNISRGPLVDEIALIAALESGVISGAGLDVFETEPPSRNNPLLTMDNVIVTPHNIAWTDELALGMGRSALGSIFAISNGNIPDHVVNREVVETPQFKEKLKRICHETS